MSVAEAARLYAARNYAEALNVAVAASNGPEVASALLVVAKCFVALSNVPGLNRILQIGEQAGTPPAYTLFRVLGTCLVDGLYAPLIRLEPAFPEGTLLFPIALYHAACARMMQGDADGAARGFDRFRLAMPRYLNALPFGTDDAFNTMFRQATLVLPRDLTAKRIAEGRAMPPAQQDFQIIRPNAAAVPGPMYLCCADARYVAAFLDRWLALLAPFGRPIHVHVIDPSEDSAPLIERLAGAHGLADRLSASSSTDRYGTSTSYACARFEVAPALLEAFGRTLIAIDIDSGATPALEALAATVPAADFACFETMRCEPASVYPCGVMIFAPTQAGIAMAGDLAAFCRPRLSLPVRLNWLLDQAALFSVIRHHGHARPDCRYVALDRFTGKPMTDHIYGLAADEEKQGIKSAAAGLGGASPKDTVESSWAP